MVLVIFFFIDGVNDCLDNFILVFVFFMLFKVCGKYVVVFFMDYFVGIGLLYEL